MEAPTGAYALQCEKDAGIEIDVARESGLAQNPEGACGREGVGLGSVEIQAQLTFG